MGSLISENQLALICLTAIVIVGIWYRVDGIKEITLAVCSAMGGWMARGPAKEGGA